MNDFDFYGEGTDETGIKEVKGVTGDVTDFTFTNVSYPCIVFKDDFHCPKHKLNVIQNMVKSTVPTKDISIYFINGDDLFKIGMIDGRQVSAFVDVVGDENIVGYMDEQTKLTEGRIYTLCTLG